jgi:hypothetical protein
VSRSHALLARLLTASLLDPDRTAPAPDELSWRPPPAPEHRPTNDTYRLDIAFDLSLPLPPQLEAAKFRLVGRAAELRRKGLAAPMTVASQRPRWTQLLSLLDAAAAGKEVAETDAPLLHAAKAMARDGYRGIPRLADSSPDPD